MSKYNEFVYLQSLYGVYAEAEELVSEVSYVTELEGDTVFVIELLADITTDVALTGSLD